MFMARKKYKLSLFEICECQQRALHILFASFSSWQTVDYRYGTTKIKFLAKFHPKVLSTNNHKYKDAAQNSPTIVNAAIYTTDASIRQISQTDSIKLYATDERCTATLRCIRRIRRKLFRNY